MAVGTITPARIKQGPGKIYYAPELTAIPTFSAAGSVVTGTWTTWVEVGSTDDGLTYSESTDTADIRVAESLYNVRTVTTAKTATVQFNLSQIDTANWKLVSNGGTVTVTGAGATKLDVYIPPLVGSEVRIMLGFQSYDNEEVMVWPRCFNAAGFETVRGTFETKAGLSATFSVELPDPAVLTTPYKRWTAGGLATGV